MGKGPIFSPALVFATLAGVLTLGGVAALTWWAMPVVPNASRHAAEQAADDSAAANSNSDPTVASLSPAATDLIIGIGAGNHLVAVSDFDEDRPGADELPHIGDFDHVDWEKLAAVSPKVLVTQFGDRMPIGLRERCSQLGISLVDVRLDVIADVYREADRLGDLLGEQDQEREAVADLKQRLAAVAKEAQNFPPVRAAVAMGEGGSVSLIGPRTFHDELLTIAGGVNVAADLGKPYVNVDREQLAALSPDVVLDLEPSPPATPQQLRAAARFWQSMPDLAAVRTGNVRTITEAYAARPGWHLADLAEIFFRDLHGKTR